jgi:hypothetical protein
MRYPHNAYDCLYSLGQRLQTVNFARTWYIPRVSVLMSFLFSAACSNITQFPAGGHSISFFLPDPPPQSINSATHVLPSVIKTIFFCCGCCCCRAHCVKWKIYKTNTCNPITPHKAIVVDSLAAGADDLPEGREREEEKKYWVFYRAGWRWPGRAQAAHDAV